MQPISAILDITAHRATGLLPRIEFRQLAPAARNAAPPPLFLLGHANAVVHAELYGQLDVGEVGCYSLEDALVAPTGIALKDGCAFTSAAFIHPPHHVRTITDRLTASALPVRHIAGKLAVIYGPGHQTYGHWLADFLPRLWVLAESGHDLADMKFLVPRDLSDVSRRLLERAGIGETQLVRYAYWSEIIRADMLLMPTGLRCQNRMSPLFRQATEFWTKRLIATASAPAPEHGPRIMVSRTGGHNRRELVNRAVIEKIARSRGYAIVDPGRLSLTEQAGIFAGARCIVGEYGSGLHNTLYAGEGAIVCGLRGNARHPSFIQSGISAAMGQKLGYVLGAAEGQDIDQHYAIDIADFERALEIMELTQGHPAGAIASRADKQIATPQVKHVPRGYSPLELAEEWEQAGAVWNPGRSLPNQAMQFRSPAAQIAQRNAPVGTPGYAPAYADTIQ